MNTIAIAAALRALASAIEQPESGVGPAIVGSESIRLAPADTFESGYPVAEPPSGPPAAVATALGRCPYHDEPWEIRPAGVSKAGKPYAAFFKCDGKEPDGSFCPRRPTRAWADSHPIAP